jgi:drug/metabolite transporter (DMT)-like permease
MLKLALLTVLALFSFAGNSVLCRMALTDEVIDAASFTSIRLFSGIVFLLFLVVIKTKEKMTIATGSWLSSLLLFLYAIAFSYAYLTLDTGTGALILFGAVQATMIMSGLLKGRKFLVIEWVGLLLALLGLVALLMPGAAAPSLTGFVLMAGSGIAWAFYTLAGKNSKNPLIDTANNFLRTLPFIAMTMLLTFSEIQISNKGILLAIASGAVMSGLGYAIWYSVLPSLTLTQAAILQLTVPIIAAVGGVLFSNEVITIKLISSSILVLGGVLVVTVGRRYAEVFIKNKPNYN